MEQLGTMIALQFHRGGQNLSVNVLTNSKNEQKILAVQNLLFSFYNNFYLQ